MIHVVTGVQIMDGDPYVWVETVEATQKKAHEAIFFARQRYEEDYGQTSEEAGVEFEVHSMESPE